MSNVNSLLSFVKPKLSLPQVLIFGKKLIASKSINCDLPNIGKNIKMFSIYTGKNIDSHIHG